MKHVRHSFSCNRGGEQGTIALCVDAAPQPRGSSLTYFENVLTTSSSSYLLKGAVTTLRSFFSILVFVLLLCTLFPAAQIGWSFNMMCGSIGDPGSGQTCDFRDAGEATDSEDDSPQETPEDCVTSRVNVSDCQSSRSHTSKDVIPPSTLLVFQLLHPPTAHS
jgi:hypothetical protein